jgi:hypothetical protein
MSLCGVSSSDGLEKGKMNKKPPLERKFAWMINQKKMHGRL